MRTTLFRASVLAAGVILLAASVYSEPLSGTTGSATGATWQSSWLDLKTPATFKKGESLRIKVEGSAENVLVRFLPAASTPDSPDGIEGTVRKVPSSKVLEVKLERDHPAIKQVSVHAGREAWGRAL